MYSVTFFPYTIVKNLHRILKYKLLKIILRGNGKLARINNRKP